MRENSVGLTGFAIDIFLVFCGFSFTTCMSMSFAAEMERSTFAAVSMLIAVAPQSWKFTVP